MAITFHLESQSLQPNYSLLVNSLEKTTFFNLHLINFPYFNSSRSLLHRNQIPNSIVCARKKRRRAFGSQKVRKFVAKLIPAIASNLETLPEPLDLVISQIGGGGGGNSGFWKGFGGGKFDGWRRKGNTNLSVISFVAIYRLGLLLFGTELKNDTFYGVLALGFLVAILVNGYPRGVKDWILDVCLIGAVMGWRLRREDLHQWVNSNLLELVKGKRRSRRRRTR